MKTLAEYLELATVAHGHLCAGQVLGVRLAMLGLEELGIDDPVAERKRMVTYVEIDRCVTDAVALVANCRLGKRALKFRDWGKVAATFVDLATGRAVRIAARETSKQAAREMFPELAKEAGQQKAYAALSDEVLFAKQWVKVEVPPEDLPGFKGPRVVCAECGEGINFKREVVLGDRTVCRSCAGEKYYIPVCRVVLAFLLLSFSSVAHAHDLKMQAEPRRPAMRIITARGIKSSPTRMLSRSLDQGWAVEAPRRDCRSLEDLADRRVASRGSRTPFRMET
jgi:formylmethanofuran dehydrogenase subunit E